MYALDVLKALWILLIFAVTFFWFPAYLFFGRQSADATLKVAGNFARGVLLVTGTSFLFAALKVLNVTTVLLLFGSAILLAWVRKNAGGSRDWLAAFQATTVGMIRMLESPPILRRIGSYFPVSAAWKNHLHAKLRGRQPIVASFAIVMMLASTQHFWPSLRQLRLELPEDYSVLLRGRELMLNTHPAGQPLIFPSVIGLTALLSSTDPMQVTRFLTPIVGLFLVLAVGLVIHVCAGGRVASLAAMYCLGAAAFPPAGSSSTIPTSTWQKLASVLWIGPANTRASPEKEIGLLLLLLALAILADWYKKERGWDSLVDVACCVVLVGLISGYLLLILVLASAVLLLRPVMGLWTVVVICYALAGLSSLFPNVSFPNEVRLVLPLAAPMTAGCLLALVENSLTSRSARTNEGMLLFACFLIGLFWFRPQPVKTEYLEFDEAARMTQQIAHQHARQSWVVVAPVEQLSETLGLGGHVDLAEFVENYHGQTARPDFRFPEARENLFIYVEKRPFQIFRSEPKSVPMSVLADTTYRSYRSPAGRASVEAAALELCEQYRQCHSDMDVYFEDDNLRIYRVHR